MTRMTLRWRVAVALVAVVVPIALGFTFFSYRLRRETLLEGTYDAVLARMESGGRERCEARETFDARPGRHEGRRARRLARRAVELVARYDASLVSSDPHAPSLDPSIGEAFASGEVAVLDPTSPRGTPRVALRMPWDEGPCAVVLVPAPRGSPRRPSLARGPWRARSSSGSCSARRAPSAPSSACRSTFVT